MREIVVYRSTEELATLSENERLSEYLKSSQSPNSILAFKSDLNHFVTWGGKVPSKPDDISRYLVHYASELSVATLRRRLTSIGKAHRVRGFEDPTKSEMVKLVIKGICRIHGKPQKQAAPLLRDELLKVIEYVPDTLRGRRDKAVLLIGFAGAFRRSELVAINCKDLDFQEHAIVITIPRSKTDQMGYGRKVAIPYAAGPICPAHALKEWLRLSNITEGAVFRRIHEGRPGDRALCDRMVSVLVKRYAQMGGLHFQSYSGHSLRAGLVTSAALEGVPAYKIRAQTGHQSDAMLSRYIRDSDMITNNAVSKLF